MQDFPTAPALGEDGTEPTAPAWAAWTIAGVAGVCYLVAAGLAYQWWVG